MEPAITGLGESTPRQATRTVSHSASGIVGTEKEEAKQSDDNSTDANILNPPSFLPEFWRRSYSVRLSRNQSGSR